MDEMTCWEYRVRTFGSVLSGPKDEDLEAMLNEWGVEGWEVVSSFAHDNSSKIRVIAKRLLTRSARRQRTMPI